MDYSDYDEQPRKHHSKKDTRRWCKGKVGREHQVSIVVPKNSFAATRSKNGCGPTVKFFFEGSTKMVEDRWICYHVPVCDKCGKHIEFRSDICPLNVTGMEMFWSV